MYLAVIVVGVPEVAELAHPEIIQMDLIAVVMVQPVQATEPTVEVEIVPIQEVVLVLAEEIRIQQVLQFKQRHHVFPSILVSIQCIHPFRSQLLQWPKTTGNFLNRTIAFIAQNNP